MTRPLRQDWLDRARRDGAQDAENARGLVDAGAARLFMDQRQTFLVNMWNRSFSVSDVMALEHAWLEGAELWSGKVPFVCPLCGQRVDDGKACGCGARR